MYSKVYPFSLESLLSILVEAELPRSLQSIVIKDANKKWLKSAFCVETKELFAAKGFDMKWEGGDEEDEDDEDNGWIITVMPRAN